MTALLLNIRKKFLSGVFVCTFLIPVVAAEPPDKNKKTSTGVGRFVYSLLPKPFQSNPELEMSVYTEMTDYGRTLKHASAQAPVYYLAYDKGELKGGALIAGEKPPPREVLKDIMRRTLASAGYLPEDEGHKPSLFL